MANPQGQTPTNQALLKAAAKDRLGHALLLSTGEIDSPHFTLQLNEFLRSMLCLNAQESENSGAKPWSCGHCESCKLLQPETQQEWTHPDFNLLLPEKGGFKVENVRSLIQASYRGRGLSQRRISLVSQADKLSAAGGAAANALLKLLEEPRPSSFLVLTSDRPEALLATIRSRCQHFRLVAKSETPLDALWSEDGALAHWRALKDWILAGATSQRWLQLPGDEDRYWKNRDEALQELRSLQRGLWREFRRGAAAHLDRQAYLRIINFFDELEKLLKVLRGYGQPSLQWLNFRFNAKLGADGNN